MCYLPGDEVECAGRLSLSSACGKLRASMDFHVDVSNSDILGNHLFVVVRRSHVMCDDRNLSSIDVGAD